MPVLDPAQRAFKQDLLRPVPSGGGLFPCELYLVMGDEQAIPDGVYHYDVLHHALDSINRGSYLPAVIDAVAPIQRGASEPIYALIFSCSFQKNAFKYGEFGYRLQGLDIGIVLAQCLEVLQPLQLQGHVQYQFLDESINNLLGLESLYESVYVVVLVTQEEQSKRPRDLSTSESILPWRKPASRHKQSAQAISSWPVSAALHLASLWRDKADFVSAAALAQPEPRGQAIALKKVPVLHLAQGGAYRHSARHYFLPGEIREEDLTAILEAAGQGYTSDLSGTATTLSSQIYCIINAVTGLVPGIYCYQKSSAHLFLQKEEDMRPYIQQLAANMSYNNAYHISVYIFVIGNYEDGFSAYGNRWYRIQNLEAGIVIQRIYLATAILGLGWHTSLSYPVASMDRILQLPTGCSTLAQVMVAPEWISGQYYESAIRSIS